MRKYIYRNLYIAILALGSAGFAGAQPQKINPATQIGWPAGCQVYNVAQASCPAIGVVTFRGAWVGPPTPTTYAANDAVYFAGTNTTYVSLQNSNTNHSPDVSPTWWTVLVAGGGGGGGDSTTAASVAGALGGAVGGSANTITLALTTPSPSIPINTLVFFTPNANNTSQVTLAVPPRAAAPIKKCEFENLQIDDLVAGTVAVVFFDGSKWQLINPQAGTCGSYFGFVGNAGSPVVGVVGGPSKAGQLLITTGTATAQFGVPGSNENIFYNCSNALCGASGGLTNGTHWAFGDGAQIDDAVFIDPGGSLTPPATILNIQETVTDPALENGVFVNLDMTPSAQSPNYPYAGFFTINAHGNNWFGTPNIQGMAGVGGQVTWDGSGTGGSSFAQAIGSFGEFDNLGTGNVTVAIGQGAAVDNNSTGTIAYEAGSASEIVNIGTGAVTTAIAVDTDFQTNGNVTNGYDFHAALPGTDEPGTTITNFYGIYIEDAAQDIVTHPYQMYSASTTAPAIFLGPHEAKTYTSTVSGAAGYQEEFYTPSSSSSSCSQGQYTDDANFHYVCTASDTWKRSALSTF